MKWKKLVLDALDKILLRFSLRVACTVEIPKEREGKIQNGDPCNAFTLRFTNAVSLSLLQVASIRINTLNSWQKNCKAIALRYIYTHSSILESLK